MYYQKLQGFGASANNRLHIKKVVLGIISAALPVFGVYTLIAGYFECYNFEGESLYKPPLSFSARYQEEQCQYRAKLLVPSLFMVAPMTVVGAIILFLGLTGRSLVSGRKETASHPIDYWLRVIGGFGLFALSLPFIFFVLKNVIFNCEIDWPNCSIELSKHPVTFGVGGALMSTGIWIIFTSIKKMYPSPRSK